MTISAQKPFNELPKLPPEREKIETVKVLRQEILTTRMKISRITAAKYLKQLEGIGVLKAQQVWKETLYN